MIFRSDIVCPGLRMHKTVKCLEREKKMIVSNVIVGISAIVIFGAVIWAIIDEHNPNK